MITTIIIIIIQYYYLLYLMKSNCSCTGNVLCRWCIVLLQEIHYCNFYKYFIEITPLLYHSDYCWISKYRICIVPKSNRESECSDCWQAVHYIVYRLPVVYLLPAIAAILFYWIRMKIVQQLTCLKLDRPNGPTYLTFELLNTLLC